MATEEIAYTSLVEVKRFSLGLVAEQFGVPTPTYDSVEQLVGLLRRERWTISFSTISNELDVRRAVRSAEMEGVIIGISHIEEQTDQFRDDKSLAPCGHVCRRRKVSDHRGVRSAAAQPCTVFARASYVFRAHRVSRRFPLLDSKRMQ